MIDRDTSVWLAGHPNGALHLADARTGVVVKTFKDIPRTTQVGGHGRFCARRFVALYRSPVDGAVWFSVDERRIPIDERSVATHRRAPLGLREDLTVRSGGEATLSARRHLTPRVLLLRATEPLFGSWFDDRPEEYFSIIESSINEPGKLDHFRKVFDGRQGPWELLEGDPAFAGS